MENKGQTLENEQVYNEGQTLKNPFDYILSFSETFYINLSVATLDNFIFKNEWSYFNPKIIKQTFSLPPVWDSSSFIKNQLFHPYFGNIYFSTGRANGLNFYESFLLTATGSFIWEGLIEKGRYSINDFITTSFAGTVTGEALTRLSNKVYTSSPFLSFCLNPTFFICNFINKKQFYNFSDDNLNYKFFTSFDYTTNFSSNSFGGLAGIDFIYNNPYYHITKQPLDQFELYFYGGYLNSGKIVEFAVNGTLVSVPVFNYSNFGLCINYYMIEKNDFTHAENEIGIFYRQNNILNKNEINFNFELNYVILGSINDCWYGNGPHASFNLFFDFYKYGSISADYDIEYLFAYCGTDSFLQKIQFSYEKQMYKNFFAGIKNSFSSENHKNINSLEIYFGIRN